MWPIGCGNDPGTGTHHRALVDFGLGRDAHNVAHDCQHIISLSRLRNRSKDQRRRGQSARCFVNLLPLISLYLVMERVNREGVA